MVHSHGVRGGVVNLAPMTLGSSSMVGGWGTSGLHGRLHAFVKRAMLQQLVSPGAAVSIFLNIPPCLRPPKSVHACASI